MKSALVFVFSFTLLIGTSFSQFHYRTVASGNWGTVSTWEYFTGGSWIPAIATPNNNDSTITIRNGHTVTVFAPVTVDQVTIDVGGTLQNNAGVQITINNSPIAVGSDFIVNGTFIENGTASTIWGGGATWNLGATGTYVKTNNTNSNNWQNFYDGGASTMPATANWIIRRNSAVNIPISSTPLGAPVGAYYPNLIFENNVAGTWTTPAASSFATTVTGAYPVIKGNLDIGGSGSSTVNFLNGQNYTGLNSTQVQGNVIVRTGNTLRNFGNGLEVRGDMTINGSLIYLGGSGYRNLILSGGSPQSISATGSLNILNFQINKSSNSVTLNSPITIDNQATFTSGIINSSNPNFFILNNLTTVIIPGTTSFVNGPVRKLGFSAITFPVGKGTTYRPIGIGTGVGGTGAFWTETFGTATCAARGTLANGFNSGNGAWTQTNGTNGASANQWYVSPTEANMGSGVCGDGCASTAALTNSTLHLSAIGGLCGTPDCGSAYNATGAANITDRRVESPSINCTGYSTITLSFLYIGNGQGVSDNCILWYFDGVSWAILTDPASTATCGPLCGLGICQGIWTPFSIALPASANNNPNVKIGFQWVNNGDGVGSDPSFGVDNVTLSASGPSGIFTAEYFPNNPQVPYGNLLVPTLYNLSNCEYWILTRDAGTDSRLVTLSWNAASCNASNFATFQIARHDGVSTWQDHDGTPIGSAAGGTITTPVVVTNFSPFAIADSIGPLPIELIQFNGTCENGKVKLNWQTSSEINNEYFTIERSNDMVEWEEVKRIPGAGNSNSILSYETFDPDPQPSSYYRLRQTDYNGKTETFNPVFVKCSSAQNSIRVFPNPSTGIVNIDIPTGAVMQSVEVINSLGQPVLNLITGDVKGGTVHTIDLSQLQSGTYYLRILVDGEWITTPVNLIR